jgi:CheY-like chemotaxis protein
MATQGQFSALVVDNNLMSRQTLSTILRQEAQVKDIFQSSSGRDALSILKQQAKIDWIFAEAELPDQNCFDFIAEAKKIPSGTESSIIMISSSTNRELLLKAASSGVNDFIKKPFTSSTLSVKLKRLIEGKAQRKAQRVSLFEAITADLKFDSVTLPSSVVDISAGGCLVKCEPAITARIYDIATIMIQMTGGPVVVDAELVRLERHQSEEGKRVLAAFQFKSPSDATIKQLAKLLTTIKADSNADKK